MDEKGANTFPFHNLPPELKIYQGLSCSFHPFLILDKRKVVATLAICDNYDKTLKRTRKTLIDFEFGG